MERFGYALVLGAFVSACGGNTSHAEVDAGSMEPEAGAPCIATSDCSQGLECGWSMEKRPNCGEPGVCVKPGCFGDGGVCHWSGFPVCGCDGRPVSFIVMTSNAQPNGGTTTRIDYASAPVADGRCYPDAGGSGG